MPRSTPGTYSQARMHTPGLAEQLSGLDRSHTNHPTPHTPPLSPSPQPHRWIQAKPESTVLSGVWRGASSGEGVRMTS